MADETADLIRDLRRKLAEAGVEGSPPPGQDTTIGQWSRRAHDAEEQVRQLKSGIIEAMRHTTDVGPAWHALHAALAATASPST